MAVPKVELLKGKNVKFEQSVKNSRGTSSYDDVTVEVVTFDGVDIKHKIEVKNCLNSDCVDLKTIKEQFIERDLFNATDINQIKWKIYGQDFTKAQFVEYLKKNKDALDDLLKNNEQKLKIEEWFNVKEGQTSLSEKNIDEFVSKYYSEIFI